MFYKNLIIIVTFNYVFIYIKDILLTKLFVFVMYYLSNYNKLLTEI